jgi:hypothetical protein
MLVYKLAEKDTSRWKNEQQRKEAKQCDIRQRRYPASNSKDTRQSQNNRSKHVNRTLLAGQQARTLWILGTGAETATTAIANLGLEPLTVRGADENNYWQTTSDAPNLQTVLTRLERREDHLEETPEWIVVPLTHCFFHSTERRDRLKAAIAKGKALNSLQVFLTRTERARQRGNLPEERPEWIVVPLTHQLFRTTAIQERFEEAVVQGKARNSKAMICIWTTPNRKEEERQTAIVQEWAEDIGWKTTTGQLTNEQHDGYLEGRSTYLIAADERIIKKLPKQFHESNDGYHYLEQILDMGDGIIKDCFSYFTATKEDRKPSGTGARVKTQITVSHEGQEKNIDIFDRTSIGPTLVGKRHAFGTSAFAIEATDGITTQKARPIRKHELLAAFGFEPEHIALPNY